MGYDPTVDQVSRAPQVLDVLDGCARRFTFPALDNGYVNLCATRMSLHRSLTDWAIVIEVFGYSPRAGSPDLHIYTFASCLHDQKSENDFVSPDAYESYLLANPNNESRFFWPVTDDSWIDSDGEGVRQNAIEVRVRGEAVELPPVDAYKRLGIDLRNASPPAVFEVCRYLAATRRDNVLASSTERTVNLLPDLEEILVLEDWYHPDIVGGELPSATTTFQQLALVLETGNLAVYEPSDTPNTHWSNWPEGGTL